MTRIQETPARAARAAAAPSSKQSINKKWIGLGVAVIVGLLLLALPTPQGLTRPAQSVLAITAFTVTLWIFQVINNGVASILMMALMIPAGVPPAQALSGFSAPSFWILVSVLFYGCAMQRTGLAQRISYYILSLFPGTYTGILSAFFFIGFVLALGIPSMTVRTAIMVPIAWALVQSLGIAPQSRGSALIMLTTVEMAVVPGVAFLYGSLNGPVIQSVFQTKNIPLTWLGYAQVMAIPTLIFCALLIIANQFVMPPESPLKISSGFAKKELKGLGSLKQSELVTGIVVLVSIVLWATDRIHHLPSFFVGMVALAVFALAGIIKDSDIGTGVSWTLLLFVGGIFSLANVIQQYKVTDWLAGYFVPIATQLTFSAVVVMIVMTLAVLLLRFLDPTGFIVIPVLFLPIVDLMNAAGIPPMVVVAPTTIASAPFWLSYQNIWIAMSEGITSNQAYTGGQRVRIATTYAGAVLATIVLAVGFWKLIGVV
jgi:anion transporter